VTAHADTLAEHRAAAANARLAVDSAGRPPSSSTPSRRSRTRRRPPTAATGGSAGPSTGSVEPDGSQQPRAPSPTGTATALSVPPTARRSSPARTCRPSPEKSTNPFFRSVPAVHAAVGGRRRSRGGRPPSPRRSAEGSPASRPAPWAASPALPPFVRFPLRSRRASTAAAAAERSREKRRRERRELEE
jgi:hypothetical protein